MASANALTSFAFSAAGAGGVGCSGPPPIQRRGSCMIIHGTNNWRDKRWIDVSCRTDWVYLAATGCCVAANNNLWCSGL